MTSFNLQASQTVLLIIDMQEKLFASVENNLTVLQTMCQLVEGFQILKLPILISEQYPQGLGQTIESLQNLLAGSYHPWIKSTFSCIDNSDFFNYMISLPYLQWVVVGIEAHICVLQTVKGLLKVGKQVAVLQDVVASRFLADCLTALTEMREVGARVSSVETIFFELLKDSQHPQFKSISNLIKTRCTY